MRICLVYDCLYPFTVGGAERWYGALAAELVKAGHEVTYLTRRQWVVDEVVSIPGVEIVPVSAGGELYNTTGGRRLLPPLLFAAGVGWHLLCRRERYRLVHTCSFPYFPLLTARLALLFSRTSLEADWFEVWTRRYWCDYAGPVLGRIGYAVQRLCVRLTPKAFTFSALSTERLRREGFAGSLVQLSGLYGGPFEAAPTLQPSRPPFVLYAGRHTVEKRVDVVPDAVAAARKHVPELRAVILGDGPLRPAVMARIAELGLEGVAVAPGFVPAEEVAEAMRQATCLVVPSSREGYGLVVVEAAACGTPVVMVAGEDNAAVELVRPGVNGFIVPDTSPESIASGIVAVHGGGEALRTRCFEWFRERAPELSAAASAREVLQNLSYVP